MPYEVTRFDETPNPNAVKCVLDRRATEAPRSYFNAAQAEADPLARTLFAIEGVTNVLIVGDWVTVGKAPAASWSTIKAAVKRTLRAAD